MVQLIYHKIIQYNLVSLWIIFHYVLNVDSIQFLKFNIVNL